MESGWIICDPNGNVASYNPAVLKILDSPEEKLETHNIYELPEGIVDEFNIALTGELHPVAQVIRSRKPVKRFVMGQKEDNQEDILWIMVDSYPSFKDGNNGELEWVFSRVRRFTPENRIKKQLEEIKKRHQLLFENGPVAVAYAKIKFDDAGRAIDSLFLKVNKNFVKLTGVDPTGKWATEALPGIENEPFNWIQTFGEVAKTGKSVRLQNKFKSDKRWYDLVAFKSLENEIVAAFLDITETKRSHELQLRLNDQLSKRNKQLATARRKAESSDKLKSAFLSNLGHEIRTPMNGILGFADIIREGDLDKNEVLEYLDVIQGSGERMLEILQDIIEMSKLEAGMIEVKKEVFDLCYVLEHQFRFFKHQAMAKNISFHFDYLEQEIPVNSDRLKIEQIITNLLKNAIKFTENGHVTLRVLPLNGEIEILIEDSGPGISENDLKSIFRPFFQTDSGANRKYEGTGLGLSISQSLAKLLDTKITVQSNPGEGSRFTFRLPLESRGND
ncbi:MAG: PAS domain-containing sensor histidine kinase [Opitutales bacterium]|nr:PAS domain-containing sensor histidine kinase [Opitutales bacterium]